MENKDKFKAGAKSYRKGFLLGAFLGIVICIWLQKTVLSLPILLGLVGGSIALNLKVK